MKVFLVLSALIILLFASAAYGRCRRPLIKAAENAAGGLCAMALVNVTSGRTGCYIAVNRRTVFVASVLSLPGVITLVLMKIIFNY